MGIMKLQKAYELC